MPPAAVASESEVGSLATAADLSATLTSGVEVNMAAETATSSECSNENPVAEKSTAEVSTSEQADSEPSKDGMNVDP